MKVYKVELLIVDHDGIGHDEIRTILENTSYPNHCMYPEVMLMDVRDVEWNDDHPLNMAKTRDASYRELFGRGDTDRHD